MAWRSGAKYGANGRRNSITLRHSHRMNASQKPVCTELLHEWHTLRRRVGGPSNEGATPLPQTATVLFRPEAIARRLTELRADMEGLGCPIPED